MPFCVNNHVKFTNLITLIGENFKFNELKNKNLYVYTQYSFKKMNQFCGPLAQLVEQFPFKEWVDGSSPSRLTTIVCLITII